MSALRRLMRWLEPRPLRRSIGARVLAGFGLTAALTLAVALVSLAYNIDAGRDLARVSEHERAVSADLRDLEVAVEQQSGAVQNFLLSGDERDLARLESGRQRFAEALARLERRLPSGPSRAGLDEIRRWAHGSDDP